MQTIYLHQLADVGFIFDRPANVCYRYAVGEQSGFESENEVDSLSPAQSQVKIFDKTPILLNK